MRFSRQINILSFKLNSSNINADSRKTFLDRIKLSFNNNYNYIDSVNFNYYSRYIEQIGLQYPEFPKLQQLIDVAHAQDIYEMFVGDDYNLYNLTLTMDSLEKYDSNFYGDSLEKDVKLTLPRIIDLLTKMETVSLAKFKLVNILIV